MFEKENTFKRQLFGLFVQIKKLNLNFVLTKQIIVGNINTYIY